MAGQNAMPSTWQPPKLVRGSGRQAIAQAGLSPDEIDGVVTVSTTGIATPSLEARVGPRLGLRRRRPPGTRFRPRLRRRGHRPAAATRGSPPRNPGSTMAVRHRRDLLHFHPARQRRSRGGRRDCLVRGWRSGGGGHQRRAQPRADHRRRREALARYARIMGWDVEDPGLAVVFDRAIPPFIEADLAEPSMRCAPSSASPAAISTACAAIRRSEGDRRHRDRRSISIRVSSTSSARFCATMAI